MPQDDLLMQLLLSGNQPDPTAQFLAQTFMEGRVPGDQGAALQNVLTNLSPNVMAERRRLGPGMGEGLGLSEDDTGQAVQQMLGLRMSPVEQRDQELNTLKFMSEFLTTQAEEGRKERETVVKEKGATTAQSRLDLEQARDQSLIAYREALENRATADTQNTEDIIAIRRAAREDAHPDGTPLTPDERQFYRSIAGARADPNDAPKLLMASKMLQSGVDAERQFAAQVISSVTGYDTSHLADPPTALGRLLRAVEGRLGGEAMGGEPTAEELGAAGVGGEIPADQMDLLQQRQLQLRQDMLDYVQGLEEGR